MSAAISSGSVVRYIHGGRYGIVTDRFHDDDVEEFPLGEWVRVTSTTGSGLVKVEHLEAVSIADDPHPLLAAVHESTADGSVFLAALAVPMDVHRFGGLLSALSEVVPSAVLGKHRHGSRVVVIVDAAAGVEGHNE